MGNKLLLVTQNFYPVIGSAGNRMHRLFQMLHQQSITTHVLTTEPLYPNKQLYEDEKYWDDPIMNAMCDKVFRIKVRQSSYSSSLWRRLFFFLELMLRFFLFLWRNRNSGYTYIYVTSPPIFIVFSVLVCNVFIRAKVILEIRDLWPDSLLGIKKFNNRMIVTIFRFLEKIMYKKADVIVINSIGFKQHVKVHLAGKSTPLIYIPNGPLMEEIVQTKRPFPKFRVVYSGNIGLAQDVDCLKRIAKLFHEQSIRFDVIGYGVKRNEFVEFIRENELTSIHVHGPLTRRECLHHISKCHIGLAVLNNEDVFTTVLPGKIVDYLTCKTPVVACVQGVSAHLIHENRVGYAYEQDCLEKIVEQIVKLKNDVHLRKELEENCLHTVLEHFLLEHNIDRLMNEINQDFEYREVAEE